MPTINCMCHEQRNHAYLNSNILKKQVGYSSATNNRSSPLVNGVWAVRVQYWCWHLNYMSNLKAEQGKHFKKFTTPTEKQSWEESIKYLVIEVTIQAQNVRVPEMRLDFNFTPQLMFNLGLLQLVLEQHFECHHILALPTAIIQPHTCYTKYIWTSPAHLGIVLASSSVEIHLWTTGTYCVFKIGMVKYVLKPVHLALQPSHQGLRHHETENEFMHACVVVQDQTSDLSLTSKINIAKLPPSQRLSNIEVC